MASVSHRATRAKNTTISTSRRHAAKHPAATPRRASRPARSPAAPLRRPTASTPMDRSTLRGTINKALRALLQRLAKAPSIDGSGTGPAALVRLVLGALVLMLEHADGERQEAHQRAALAFAEAVQAASGKGRGGAGGPPTSRSPSEPPGSGERPPARHGRPPCKPAAPYLRAVGFECDATALAAHEAPLADMIPLLFRGESDPVLGILQSIARDTTIISIALRDNESDIREEIDMALHVLGERAKVAAELYNRMPTGGEGDGR